MKAKTRILTPAPSAITSDMVDQYRQRDAVDEKFERITPQQTQVEILPDERGDVIRGYDETHGL